MDIVKELLVYLDKGGIGNYVDITPVLIQHYGDPINAESDAEFMASATKIRSFLAELQRNALIDVKRRGPFGSVIGGERQSFDKAKLIAKITYKGSKSLEEFPFKEQVLHPAQNNIYITGDVTGSFLGFQDLDEVNFQPTVKQTKIVKTNSAGKDSVWTILGTVATLIATIIAINSC